MLAINNLSLQYGEKNLFRDLSVRILPEERIGLVGVNGAGKTTLMRIIAGLHPVADGTVTSAKRTTIGYLPQETNALQSDNTLYKEAETAFADVLAMQAELEQVNMRLSKADSSAEDFPTLLARQGDLQHRLDLSDIFRMRSQIEKVLGGLGFSEEDFTRKCSTFSGGWLMRLMLAKLLLTAPDILLLDEPTNHLDIESLTWLEDFLKAYRGAMIIISHDRDFLDNLTGSTWELSLGRLTVYRGNYSFYQQERETRLVVQRAAYDNQQARIQQTMRFVDRFRAKSTKASQVQSRLKQLEKMELLELEDSDKSISFHFPPSPASGKLVLETDNLGKRYGDKRVFDDLSFQLLRGEKIAVVGVNGAGKSTLARILAGKVSASSGTFQLGHNVQAAYFGQHQAQELPQDFTVLETLSRETSDMTVTQLRSLLGAFLFRGEDVEKKVRVLSGGEKSRLALAKIIVTRANLLILDEPTNHLDIVSQDILRNAMAEYDGSILVISHNRYFLNGFVNKVLEIKKGSATLYLGNLEDYLAKVLEERELAVANKANQQDDAPADHKPRSKEARRMQAQVRQEKSRLLTPHKKKSAEAEEEIELLETRKTELEGILADPALYKDQEAFSEKNREYQSVLRRLERAYAKWEAAQTEIEAIEKTFADCE